MQRSFSAYSVGVLAIALAFAVTPVFAQETAVTSVTKQTTSPDAWTQNLLEQYRAFTAKKLGETKSDGLKSDPKSTSKNMAAVGVLGRKIWNASTTASTTECVQKAVDTREAAVGAAWLAHNAAMTEGFLARQTALVQAWGITDVTERGVALAAAWSAWDATHSSTTNKIKAARTSLWNTYKTTMRETCRVGVPRQEALKRDTLGKMSI